MRYTFLFALNRIIPRSLVDVTIATPAAQGAPTLTGIYEFKNMVNITLLSNDIRYKFRPILIPVDTGFCFPAGTRRACQSLCPLVSVSSRWDTFYCSNSVKKEYKKERRRIEEPPPHLRLT